MKTLLIPLSLCALASPLSAQNLFRASFNGDQETPPTASAAAGWGTAVLNLGDTVTYHLEVVGLTATSAHIQLAPPGLSGGILVTLAGGPIVWDGTSAPLAAAEVAALRAGGTYFNLISAAFSGGEIRGQILAAPAEFAMNADGAQEVPPSGSLATASGSLFVNPDRSITYAISAVGITASSAHIHTGFVGSRGPLLFTLSGGPALYSGTTRPMSEAEFELLQAQGMYVNLHAMNFPFDAELRGQILALGQAYGFGCPGPGGIHAQLLATGAPQAGHEVELQVLNGVPGGKGLVGLSALPAARLISGCQVFIQLPLLRTISMSLDGAGHASLLLTLPLLAADRTIFLQFAGLQGGLSYSSNALALRIAVL